MYFHFLYLLTVINGFKKQIIFRHKIQLVTIRGQLLSPDDLPIGIIPMEFNINNNQQFSLSSDNQGKFSTAFQSQETQFFGVIKMEVAEQFEQNHYWHEVSKNNIIELGNITINNNQTQETLITGKIEGFNIQNAKINLNYSQPIWLREINITTDENGTFKSNQKLMKLMLYGVQVMISLEGYEIWHCDQELPKICNPGLALFNQYIYQFPDDSIKLKPLFAEATIITKIIDLQNKPLEGIQVTALCQVTSGEAQVAYSFNPVISDTFGMAYLISNSTLRTYREYYCLIYTLSNFNVNGEFILLKEFQWDGSKDQTKWIKLQ